MNTVKVMLQCKSNFNIKIFIVLQQNCIQTKQLLKNILTERIMYEIVLK